MTVTPFPDLAGDEPVVADGPRLIGARCGACGTAWFPRRPVCPSCAAPEPERLLLGPAGTLYSWSTVHVSSSRPVPYTLGYVDLPAGVRVLATIRGTGLTPGGPVRLAVGPAGTAGTPGPAASPVTAAPHWWFEPEGDPS
jgi:uncharacterized OB-fold protein